MKSAPCQHNNHAGCCFAYCNCTCHAKVTPEEAILFQQLDRWYETLAPDVRARVTAMMDKDHFTDGDGKRLFNEFKDDPNFPAALIEAVAILIHLTPSRYAGYKDNADQN